MNYQAWELASTGGGDTGGDQSEFRDTGPSMLDMLSVALFFFQGEQTRCAFWFLEGGGVASSRSIPFWSQHCKM